MYVISLSCKKLKQITRIELKWTNVYNTLRETKSSAWRNAICCHSFTKVTSLSGHSHCHHNPATTLYFLEMWSVPLPEILKLCHWKWEYDHEVPIHNMNEWTLNSYIALSRNVSLCKICTVSEHIKSTCMSLSNS
jgi:hypothetical protein